MLEPNDRRLLLDSLRPPEGYELTEAVGTTYSLDLYALLSVPVAFAFREALSEDGQANPLATLEGLRRVADRMHLFCQAGEIHIPRDQQRLFAYLEDAVIPVTPAIEGGVFHPKGWLLRFADDDGHVAYRFICLSRNLTFDRSWDTALILDGELMSQPVDDPDPDPLRRFVASLPTLATHPVRAATQSSVDRMAAELPRVAFECPAGVDRLQFWPMGIEGATPPDFKPAKRRLLVVSPFVSEGWLREQTPKREATYLVSREDQLLALRDTVADCVTDAYTLLPEATPEDDVEAQATDEDLLSGLHAKLFIMDDGWTGRVWTGSANATQAAFHRNVEFLVELIGKRGALGIDQALAQDSSAGFRDLLAPWHPPDNDNTSEDAVAERLKELLRHTKQHLVGTQLRISVGAADEDGRYPLMIAGKAPELPPGVSGTIRTIGLDSHHARSLGSGDVGFGVVTLEAISAFVAIELTAREGSQWAESRFVLRLPLVGAPADRGNRLLRAMLQDSKTFMRLLMLLLADDGIEAMMAMADSDSASTSEAWLPGQGDMPLLESLLKTLDRSPERLDNIHRLLTDLGEAGSMDGLVPEQFFEVWDAVWSHRSVGDTQGSNNVTTPANSGRDA